MTRTKAFIQVCEFSSEGRELEICGTGAHARVNRPPLTLHKELRAGAFVARRGTSSAAMGEEHIGARRGRPTQSKGRAGNCYPDVSGPLAERGVE